MATVGLEKKTLEMTNLKVRLLRLPLTYTFPRIINLTFTAIKYVIIHL